MDAFKNIINYLVQNYHIKFHQHTESNFQDYYSRPMLLYQTPIRFADYALAFL